MKSLIKVCALGTAFIAGAIAGQPGQVQATSRQIMAGPIEITGQPAPAVKEAVNWPQGTYKARYITVEATGYAPLDKSAVRGMCYSGNPRVTASGAKTKPGVTVAAPKNIPFGTKVFIPGHGLRLVEDRGGAIKGNKIDVCFKTRSEALEFGRRNIQIMVFEKVSGGIKK